MPLQVRLRGVTELKAQLSRWNTAAWAAAVAPRAGEVLLAALRLYIAKRTGTTADRLGYRNEGLRVVAFGDEVAGFLAWGTRPHAISGRDRMLHFLGRDGGDVFRRAVWHPGTQATLFHQQAWQTARGEIGAIAREEAYRLFRGG